MKRLLTLLNFAALALSVRAQNPAATLKHGDSLFFAQDWSAAEKAYTSVLTDTSHNSIAWNRLAFSEYNRGEYPAAMQHYQKALTGKPSAGLKASVYPRMARVNALQNHADAAMANIDSAIVYGYASYTDLDHHDFDKIRSDERFKQLRDKIYFTANPCMANAQAREFDFWAGEWNVYPTGAQTLVGHSLVQIVSGGCALLENWDASGGVSTGKSLNFVDGATHKWRQSWIGSYASGQQDFVDGEYKDGAMRFTFTTTDAQGHNIIGRFIFFNQGPDKVRQFNETSADGGKTWVTSYDLTYIRIHK